MRRRRNPEIIAGRVTTSTPGAAVVSATEDIFVIPSGTGIVQVVLPDDFKIVTVIASVVNASAAQITVDSIGDNFFVLRTYTPSGSAAVATTASFIAVGRQQ